MTPERWHLVEGHLADALRHSRYAGRAAFLSSCADDTALRREVESLSRNRTMSSIRARRTSAWASETAASDEYRPANRAYELVRELGPAGWRVWLGRRADREFEKLVAIKLLNARDGYR